MRRIRLPAGVVHRDADPPAAGQPGCGHGETPSTAPIVLHRFAQLDPTATLVDPAEFADLRRWRQPISPRRPALVFSRTADGLNLRISALPPPAPAAPGAPRPDDGPPVPDRWTVEVADAPLPLPAVAFGIPVDERAGGVDYPLLSSARVPVRPIATGAPLPRVGATGMLMDLEYADRLVRSLDGAQEVWLARDAPAGLLDRLRDQELVIIDNDSVDAMTDQYAAQGGHAVLRLYLVVALAAAAGRRIGGAGRCRRPARPRRRVSAAAGAGGTRPGGAARGARRVRRRRRGGDGSRGAGRAPRAPGRRRRPAAVRRRVGRDRPARPSWLAIGVLAAGLAVAFVPAVLVASARPESGETQS